MYSYLDLSTSRFCVIVIICVIRGGILDQVCGIWYVYLDLDCKLPRPDKYVLTVLNTGAETITLPPLFPIKHLEGNGTLSLPINT